MREYHKIQTVYLRDPATKFTTVLEGQYALPEFAYLAENTWVFTEKVDGTNIRMMWDGEQEAITFGGKTDAAQIPGPLLTRLRERFPDGGAFRAAFPAARVCLYGEGFGAGIQEGRLYRADQDFVLFDVKVGDWWLQRADVEDVAATFGLEVAPVIGRGTLPEMVAIARAGFASRWNNAPAEGIVARPEVELCTRGGERLITKVKHKDFGARR